MCHVEQSSSGVPLHPHVPRLGQSRQWAESTGAGNLGLVLLMGRQVRDAADGIALDFDIGREHLSDEGGQTAQLDDQDLVLG